MNYLKKKKNNKYFQLLTETIELVISVIIQIKFDISNKDILHIICNSFFF